MTHTSENHQTMVDRQYQKQPNEEHWDEAGKGQVDGGRHRGRNRAPYRVDTSLKLDKLCPTRYLIE